ncbi:unnamed protein product [Notodromas monacha]|uniref:HTH CENPB-type domain-containing protein n=1 Tax=Notodromas monacha TaxID=399045 RepID=A0A7R9GIL8_9CRUS|nr:unnamed protein product [Notodromas monacha]CAG0921919.1 unnamed protein product [Notodromas monacha]
MTPQRCRKNEKRRNVLTVEFKQEIIRKREMGRGVRDLGREYGLPKSTIASIIANRNKIMAANVIRGSSLVFVNGTRTPIHEEMEQLLMGWIDESKEKGDRITRDIICEKARSIFEALKCSEKEEEFKASRGWYERFKKRSSIVRQGENVPSVEEAPEELIIELNTDELQTLLQDTHEVKQEFFLEPDDSRATSSTAFVESNLQMWEEFKPQEVKQEFSPIPDHSTTANSPNAVIEEHLQMWEKVKAFVLEYHPDNVEASRLVEIFGENVMHHFKELLEKRGQHITPERTINSQTFQEVGVDIEVHAEQLNLLQNTLKAGAEKERKKQTTLDRFLSPPHPKKAVREGEMNAAQLSLLPAVGSAELCLT